jgi:thioesterase domain-containing protein
VARTTIAWPVTNRGNHIGALPNGPDIWLEKTAMGLRWGETLWIKAQKPINTASTALTNPTRHDEALVPLFMLPSLPQLSTDYLELAKACDPTQPLFALYLPSSRRTAVFARSLDDIVRLYVEEIVRIKPAGPIALGGWSAGATIAYAVAVDLLARGREVPCLVAIDGAMPSVDPGPRRWSAKILLAHHRTVSALAYLPALFKQGSIENPFGSRLLWCAIASVWDTPQFRLLRRLVPSPVASSLGARYPGLSAFLERHPATFALDLESFPPDHCACAIELYDAVCAYVPSVNYTGEMLVFEATAEPARSSARVVERWAAVAHNLTAVSVKGMHRSIITEPDVLPLARELCTRLREVSRRDQSASSGRAPAAR